MGMAELPIPQGTAPWSCEDFEPLYDHIRCMVQKLIEPKKKWEGENSILFNYPDNLGFFFGMKLCNIEFLSTKSSQTWVKKRGFWAEKKVVHIFVFKNKRGRKNSQ